MSIKLILRSAALLGVAVAALAIAPVAMAIDQGFAPRPDFPGAKQTTGKAKKKMPQSTMKATSKAHAQRNHAKRHAS